MFFHDYEKPSAPSKVSAHFCLRTRQHKRPSDVQSSQFTVHSSQFVSACPVDFNFVHSAGKIQNKFKMKQFPLKRLKKLSVHSLRLCEESSDIRMLEEWLPGLALMHLYHDPSTLQLTTSVEPFSPSTRGITRRGCSNIRVHAKAMDPKKLT